MIPSLQVRMKVNHTIVKIWEVHYPNTMNFSGWTINSFGSLQLLGEG